MNPNESHDFASGCMIGMIVGAVVFVVFLCCLVESPHTVEERWQREATKRGYGGMVLEGDKFAWKWNEQEKTNESE